MPRQYLEMGHNCFSGIPPTIALSPDVIHCHSWQSKVTTLYTDFCRQHGREAKECIDLLKPSCSMCTVCFDILKPCHSTHRVNLYAFMCLTINSYSFAKQH